MIQCFRSVFFAGLFSLLALSAESNVQERIVLTGSSTVAPLALEIAKAYEKKNSQIKIDVQSGGSSRGFADLRRGLSHVGMVSRELKEGERFFAYPIARDGIAIILNQRNSVGALSREQVIQIYRGEVQNWKELGGRSMPITVVHKAEGRSTLELFLKHYDLRNSDVRPSVIIGENEQGIKTVSGNEGAIGYVSIGAAEYSQSQGVSIKLVPLNGVVPSRESVAKGRFPLSRVLNFITLKEPSGQVKDFIRFAQSAEVRSIVEKQHFIAP